MVKIKVLIDPFTTSENGNLKKIIFDRGKTSNPSQGAGKKVYCSQSAENKQVLPKPWRASNRCQSYKEQLPRAEKKQPLLSNRSQSCEEPSPRAGKLNKQTAAMGGSKKGGSHTAGEAGVESKGSKSFVKQWLASCTGRQRNSSSFLFAHRDEIITGLQCRYRENNSIFNWRNLL